jgi:pyruvate/2-oxoglutarate dehydrogenase complex dihydrolipoamide dehydrogenase (E3) component
VQDWGSSRCDGHKCRTFPCARLCLAGNASHFQPDARGFREALVEADSDRILAFGMLGAEAGQVMAAVQTAMLGGMAEGSRRAFLERSGSVSP